MFKKKANIDINKGSTNTYLVYLSSAPVDYQFHTNSWRVSQILQVFQLPAGRIQVLTSQKEYHTLSPNWSRNSCVHDVSLACLSARRFRLDHVSLTGADCGLTAENDLKAPPSECSPKTNGDAGHKDEGLSRIVWTTDGTACESALPHDSPRPC